MLPEPVRLGIAHFNLGEYFDAHEAWEDHWGHGPLPERELTLALIKAAVALHHLESSNTAGFLWQAKEAIPRLRAHVEVWPELRVDELADTLEGLVTRVRMAGAAPDAWDRPLLGGL